MNVDNIIAYALGLVALAALLPYLDRLRQMTWRTHLWRVLGMHLLFALWLGHVVYDAFFQGDTRWSDALAIGAAGLWIATSAHTWRNGPPAYTESGRMPLDDPATK